MRAKPGMLMTSPLLKKRGVCPGWRSKFRRHFSNGRVRITQRACEDRAQTWPWDSMAEKLLNRDGFAEYVRLRVFLNDQRHQFNTLSTDQALSRRARKVALASIFGMLAQQRRYDPAHSLSGANG